MQLHCLRELICLPARARYNFTFPINGRVYNTTDTNAHCITVLRDSAFIGGSNYRKIFKFGLRHDRNNGNRSNVQHFARESV